MNEKIAVIGGGQMGSQIAALAAMAGYKTNIYDENKENLEYRYNFVEENIKNLIDKKIYSEDKLESFNENLELTYSLEDVIVGLSIVDIVVEPPKDTLEPLIVIDECCNFVLCTALFLI